jgi:hypothetical protein
MGDTYRNDCFVYVRGNTTPLEDEKEEAMMKNFWIARVLQVRAKDNSHVYALVAWMYWPDELPKPRKPSPDQVDKSGGKRTYHGTYELVASNYLEVLDVLSFAGKADVQQWDEDKDGDQIRSQLYWRQTFSRETHALSVSLSLPFPPASLEHTNYHSHFGNIVYVKATLILMSQCTSATIKHVISGYIKNASSTKLSPKSLISYHLRPTRLKLLTQPQKRTENRPISARQNHTQVSWLASLRKWGRTIRQ